jgi:hypothetical protein
MIKALHNYYLGLETWLSSSQRCYVNIEFNKFNGLYGGKEHQLVVQIVKKNIKRA